MDNNQTSVVTQQPVVANPQIPVSAPQNKQETIKVINRGVSGGKLVAIFIVTVILSVLIGAGSMVLVFHFYPDLTRDTVTNVTRLEKEVSITDKGIADAVDKVYDSVVIVKTYRRNKLYATGTGFVYKKDNYQIVHDKKSVIVLDDVIMPLQNMSKESIDYYLFGLDKANEKVLKTMTPDEVIKEITDRKW